MPRAYVIDQLIPSNEISFIFGSPGAGKSTFICHVIASSLITGKPFEIGGQTFSTSKAQIGYAAFDRSTDSIGDLLAKYDLDDKIQWRSYRNVDRPDASDQKRIHEIPADFPDCSTIVLDGLGLTIPTGKTNDYCTVGNYIRYCGTVAEKCHRTFLATLHSPKPRIGEGISNPRMGALGSTAFPGIAEAMIQVEHMDLTNPEDPNRIIRVMPHDGPAMISNWCFDHRGRLIEVQEPVIDITNAQLLKFFSELPAKFQTYEALELGDRLGFPQRTSQRYLKTLVDSSKLTQPSKGHYVKQVVC